MWSTQIFLLSWVCVVALLASGMPTAAEGGVGPDDTPRNARKGPKEAQEVVDLMYESSVTVCRQLSRFLIHSRGKERGPKLAEIIKPQRRCGWFQDIVEDALTGLKESLDEDYGIDVGDRALLDAAVGKPFYGQLQVLLKNYCKKVLVKRMPTEKMLDRLLVDLAADLGEWVVNLSSSAQGSCGASKRSGVPGAEDSAGGCTLPPSGGPKSAETPESESEYNTPIGDDEDRQWAQEQEDADENKPTEEELEDQEHAQDQDDEIVGAEEADRAAAAEDEDRDEFADADLAEGEDARFPEEVEDGEYIDEEQEELEDEAGRAAAAEGDQEEYY